MPTLTLCPSYPPFLFGSPDPPLLQPVAAPVKIIDVLFAIAVPTIWGLGFTLAKFALAEFPPIMLIALRFSVTAVALIWFVRMPRRLLPRIFLVSVVSATI